MIEVYRWLSSCGQRSMCERETDQRDRQQIKGVDKQYYYTATMAPATPVHLILASNHEALEGTCYA